MVHIILLSRDHKLHPLLASALATPECSVVLEPDKNQLKQRAAAGQADVLIVDFDLKYSSLQQQLALFDEIADAPVPIVAMIDDSSRLAATELLQRGAFDCVRKPPNLVELKVVVRRAYEHSRLKAGLENMRKCVDLTRRCDQLVGSSGRAQVVYDLIRRVADLKAFVLLTGESGTGKELVARAIHNLGNRAGRPFVAVSCGAIPETLIESELFGHEKGAYTGSVNARSGYLEQAGDGTLFLDEIGELSLSTQVKLLRVLQQKEFTRLGSNKPIPLRARVLFATHRNLQEMVEAGTFRRDLYFRVNVMTINIPPLRDRTEDIPMLARHFLERYAAEYEKPVTDIRPNAMELLVEHDWPGNIRELENVIQKAVIMADGDSLTCADLAEYIQNLSAPELRSGGLEPECFDEMLRQFKVSLATRAISECNGNKSLAARKLRVSRAYIHRLIRMGPAGGPSAADDEPASDAA